MKKEGNNLIKKVFKYIFIVTIIFGGAAIAFTQTTIGPLAEKEFPPLMTVDGGGVDIDGHIVVQREPYYGCGHKLTDYRDGNEYETVSLADRCWFAEDLRYDNGCTGNTWDDSAPLNACANADDGTNDYGNLLYQWGAAMDGSTEEYTQGLCPDEWFIPTDEIWKELEGYVDSTYGVGDAVWDGTSYRGDDAGDQLKDPDEAWCNGTPCGESGWDALPSGYRFTSGSLFNVGSYGYWWSSSVDGGNAWYRYLGSSNSGVHRYSRSQANGYSVRCVSFKCGDDLYYEGHYYSTVEIGDQCWFAEDLRYDNGCSGNTWNYSAPFNACANADDGTNDYGNLLYQWGAAMDGSTTEGAQGLCPDGWHIPTDDEIKELEGYVDSTYGVGNAVWDGTSYRGDDAGDQLKDPDEAWCNGTPCGESGWDALPGGYRITSGSLRSVGSHGFWWSSSVDGGNAWYRFLYSSISGVNRSSFSQAFGLSVRCLRD